MLPPFGAQFPMEPRCLARMMNFYLCTSRMSCADYESGNKPCDKVKAAHPDDCPPI